MIDSESPDGLELVAGRTCGECNVCCTALTIDDPELQKPQGTLCRHAQPDHSCAVYATRPHTCRTFYCGWRRLKWVRESLRPDRSGVLIRLHGEIAADGTRTLGAEFALLNAAALRAEGLAESIAAAVAAKVPVFLRVPAESGDKSAQARINEALEAAVHARDKAGMLRILRKLYTVGRDGLRRRAGSPSPQPSPASGRGGKGRGAGG